MKKVLLALLVAGLSTQAFAMVIRGGGPYGTSDPEQIFAKVKNTTASTVPRGCVMKPDTSADDGVSFFANGALGANVSCVMAEQTAQNAFGLCQVYGYHSAVLVRGDISATAAGSRLQGAATACFADGGNTAGSNSLGIALDVQSTSTTVKAFLQVM